VHLVEGAFTGLHQADAVEGVLVGPVDAADLGAIFSLMARPAASSAARLMRRPLESFSMLLESMLWVPVSWRWALKASTLA